jgi:hypothetical protein
MRRVLALWLALFTITTHAAEPDWNTLLAQGASLRANGHVQQSIDFLRAAAPNATTARRRAELDGELGTSLLQARMSDAAAPPLMRAHDFFTGPERARYALELGNLHARARRQGEATRLYDEAALLAGPGSGLGLSALLNKAAIAPAASRPTLLKQLSDTLRAQPAAQQRGAAHLNLAQQLMQLDRPDIALAYAHIEQARQLAVRDGDARLELEAADALAAMYETQGRHAESLGITLDALASARRLDPALVTDLQIALEWRQARLRQRLGSDDAALAAYERAVSQLQASRNDIPIEYDNGHSSYSDTIAPLQLGFAGMLLARAGEQPGNLRRVIDVVEQIKQAELQDYLGDRCAVEAVQGGQVAKPGPGVAVLYPIIFPDRVELLLETAAGIERRTTPVSQDALAATSARLALALRNGTGDVRQPARLLYDWLLRPFDTGLDRAAITTLVVVPDGALRLLPFSVLHDG